MKKTLIIAPLALLAVACANTQTAQQPATADAATTIAAAEAARAKASALGYEWRDTGKLIANAKKAQAAKDEAKAVSLATMALHQSENALKQQAAQKDAASRF
jgi:hypothetical protein